MKGISQKSLDAILDLSLISGASIAHGCVLVSSVPNNLEHIWAYGISSLAAVTSSRYSGGRPADFSVAMLAGPTVAFGIESGGVFASAVVGTAVGMGVTATANLYRSARAYRAKKNNNSYQSSNSTVQ